MVDTELAVRSAGMAWRGSTAPTGRDIVQLGRADLERLEAEVREHAAAGRTPGLLEDLRLGPPIPDPDKILCLGLNYVEHATETSLKLPSMPILFAKFRNCLIGSREPIVLPATSDEVDYEGELAVVIGRRCRDVAKADALDVVAGFMPFNDVSARDLQMRTSQWTAGKAIDGFAPSGPTLTLAGSVADPQALRIATRLNGTTVQEANTSMMIFSIAETIEMISGLMTLEPGDIVATGTPAGVGFTREPPVFLRHGDIVEVEIEGLGRLCNPVVDPSRVEPHPTTSLVA